MDKQELITKKIVSFEVAQQWGLHHTYYFSFAPLVCRIVMFSDVNDVDTGNS